MLKRQIYLHFNQNTAEINSMKKTRYIIVVVLGFLLTVYNGCSPFEANFSSSSARQQVSLEAFETTLHPTLVMHCGQCHGEIQNPKFSMTDPEGAHSVVMQRGLVDFGNPSSSYFMQKLSAGHNSFNSSVIDSVRSKIQSWVQVMADYDKSVNVTPGPVGGGNRFEEASAGSILAKIKFITNGGAVTEGEYKEHAADINNKTKLRNLVQRWMDTPEGKAKLDFYLLRALNQDVEYGEGTERLLGINRNNNFLNSLKESTQRTAMDLVDRNRPFTEIATTKRFAVNTALLTAFAYIDRRDRGDSFNNFINGTRDTPTPLTAADYNDWRFITFRQSGTQQPKFDNLNHWRGIANNATVPFGVPRVGYFSMLAFQSNYPTNDANEYRVTINQTLIAGLGRTFSPSDTTNQPQMIHMDDEHSPANTQCFQCHRLMDPMRMVFANNMNERYQYSDRNTDVVSSFAFYNYVKPMANLDDLGDAIAKHPDFAKAWTQKLCVAFNTEKCLENDPEFLRVARVFSQGNFNFKTLYRELATSSLVTGSKITETSKNLEFAVARTRRTHFCQNLNVRQRQIQQKRGIAMSAYDEGAEICNRIRGEDGLGDDLSVRGLTEVVNSFPLDTFARQALEITCSNLADYLDNSARGFDSNIANLQENITNMTEFIAGLPQSHPRHAAVKDSLALVFNYSKNTLSMSDRDSFREAFKFACTSPDFVGVGL